MTSNDFMRKRADRELERLEAFVRKPQDAATVQQKLVRAAETGRFEAIVAAAQPAEPPQMVTPEEREAERRATGQWMDEPTAKPEALKPEPKEPEPKPLEPGMPTEPTPGMKWAEELMKKPPLGPRPSRPRIPYGRCLVEYDVLTGEIIGDGYDHRFDGDDE